MERDIEKLNMELIQAQILLRASHDLYQDLLAETVRHKFSDATVAAADHSREIRLRVAKFTQRDEEIRRMLLRLNKLGNPSRKMAG